MFLTLKKLKRKNLLGILAVFLLIFGPFMAFAFGGEPEDPTAKLAVTPQGYDDMAQILKRLGFKANTIAVGDLADINKLKKYDAIYINCSGDVASVSKSAAPAIREYVKGGGIIYASDWADDIVEAAFPDKINFYNEKTGTDYYGGSHVGSEGKVTADITDSGLSQVLGKSDVEVIFDLASWAVIDSVNSGVRVHMKGTHSYNDYQNYDYNNPDSSKKTKSVPFVVSFTEGKGEVLYTSFHNESQNTADMDKALNWFALRAKAGQLAQGAKNLTGEDQVLQEIVDSINKDEAKKYQFKATGKAAFSITLNFGGSEIELIVKDPEGKTLKTESVSNPPYTYKVDNAKEGTYAIEVKSVDIPEQNYPFVVAVSGKKEAAVDQPEGLVSTTETAKTTSAPKKSFKFNFKLNGALGVLLFLGIIGVVAALILRAGNKRTRESMQQPSQPQAETSAPPQAAPQEAVQAPEAPSAPEAPPAPEVKVPEEKPKKKVSKKK